MFELNLIKDKAQSRQRRRVIFLTIMMVVFLSGLLSLFVGTMIWRKGKDNDLLAKSNDNDNKVLIDKTTDLNEREPISKRRRRDMILYYNESDTVLNNRLKFTNMLVDIADVRPSGTDFWYNRLTIERPAVSRSDESKHAEADSLVSGKLKLKADGYVEINSSDVLTRNDLEAVAKRMHNIISIINEDPEFKVFIEKKVTPGRDVHAYAPFELEASRNYRSRGQVRSGGLNSNGR